MNKVKKMKKEDLCLIEPWEMEEMVGRLVNALDSALLLSVFEGIKGFHCSELTRLRKEDVEAITSDNQLMLRGKNSAGEDTSRTIVVSDLLKRLLLEASEQTVYHRENGYSNGTLSLFESPYVFRPAKLLNDNQLFEPDNESPVLVLRRFKLMAEWLRMPLLTLHSLYNKSKIQL